MGKRKRPSKVWCYYCEREFDDEKILVEHQKAKHFKCLTCHKKLSSASGMVFHALQVHKLDVTKVPNAKAGRESTEIEIFGMQGIPTENLVAQNRKEDLSLKLPKIEVLASGRINVVPGRLSAQFPPPTYNPASPPLRAPPWSVQPQPQTWFPPNTTAPLLSSPAVLVKQPLFSALNASNAPVLQPSLQAAPLGLPLSLPPPLPQPLFSINNTSIAFTQSSPFLSTEGQLNVLSSSTKLNQGADVANSASNLSTTSVHSAPSNQEDPSLKLPKIEVLASGLMDVVPRPFGAQFPPPTCGALPPVYNSAASPLRAPLWPVQPHPQTGFPPNPTAPLHSSPADLVQQLLFSALNAFIAPVLQSSFEATQLGLPLLSLPPLPQPVVPISNTSIAVTQSSPFLSSKSPLSISSSSTKITHANVVNSASNLATTSAHSASSNQDGRAFYISSHMHPSGSNTSGPTIDPLHMISSIGPELATNVVHLVWDDEAMSMEERRMSLRKYQVHDEASQIASGNAGDECCKRSILSLFKLKKKVFIGPQSHVPSLPDTPTDIPVESRLPNPVSQQRDEVIFNKSLDLRQYIDPDGDIQAVLAIRDIIRSKFDAPYISWKKIPKEIRDMWFKEFEKNFCWFPHHTSKIRNNFERWGSIRLCDMFTDAQKCEGKLLCMGDGVCFELCQQWSTPAYIQKREKAKQNRADCAELGSSLHSGGSIPHIDHRRRMKEVLCVEPTFIELHSQTHKLQNDQQWVNHNSQKVYDDYMRLDQSSSQAFTSTPQSSYGMWNQAIWGKQRDKIYGLGSHGCACEGQSSQSFTPSDNSNIEAIISKHIKALSEEMNTLISSLRTEIQELKRDVREANNH